MYLSRSIAFDFMTCVRPAPRFDPPACLSAGGLGRPVLGERKADGSRAITYDTGFRVTRRTDERGCVTVTVHDPAGWLVEEKVFDDHDDLVHLVSVTRDGATTTTYKQALTEEGWTGLRAVARGSRTATQTFVWDVATESWLPD